MLLKGKQRSCCVLIPRRQSAAHAEAKCCAGFCAPRSTLSGLHAPSRRFPVSVQRPELRVSAGRADAPVDALNMCAQASGAGNGRARGRTCRRTSRPGPRPPGSRSSGTGRRARAARGPPSGTAGRCSQGRTARAPAARTLAGKRFKTRSFIPLVRTCAHTRACTQPSLSWLGRAGPERTVQQEAGHLRWTWRARQHAYTRSGHKPHPQPRPSRLGWLSSFDGSLPGQVSHQPAAQATCTSSSVRLVCSKPGSISFERSTTRHAATLLALPVHRKRGEY